MRSRLSTTRRGGGLGCDRKATGCCRRPPAASSSWLPAAPGEPRLVVSTQQVGEGHRHPAMGPAVELRAAGPEAVHTGIGEQYEDGEPFLSDTTASPTLLGEH